MSSLVETPEYQAAERFVDLTVEKRALRARMDEIDAQLKALEPALIGYLSAAGLARFAIRDYLIYPHREPWVYPITGVSRQMVCEALKMSGLGRMVSENYSTQSLTKYVKDLEEHNRLVAGLDAGALEALLPPALGHLVNVKASFHIRVQKKERSAFTQESEAFEGDETHE